MRISDWSSDVCSSDLYNVIPDPRDAYDPAAWAEDALFRLETRRIWRSIVNLGLTDAYRALYPAQTHAYTFWDYQAGAWQRDHGIRIDDRKSTRLKSSH